MGNGPCLSAMYAKGKQFCDFLFISLDNEYVLKKGSTHNPVALRTAKTLWSFGCSECNRVKEKTLLLAKENKKEVTKVVSIVKKKMVEK